MTCAAGTIAVTPSQWRQRRLWQGNPQAMSMAADITCPRCGLVAERLHGHEGSVVCEGCGCEMEDHALQAVQQFDPSGHGQGKRVGDQNSSCKGNAKKSYVRKALVVLQEVASTLQMEAHVAIMKGYLLRAVADAWGEGRWVRRWCAAVGYIVARTRQEPIAISISTVASLTGIKLSQLYSDYREIRGLLQLRHVLETHGVSDEGVEILLAELDIPTVAAVTSMSEGGLASLGISKQDIAKIMSVAEKSARMQNVATRYPLPDGSHDPREYIDAHVKRLVPSDWFDGNAAVGNKQVV